MDLVFTAAILACGSAPEPVAPAPVAPVATASPAPMASIGGEPILPRPVVLGGLSTPAVMKAVAARREAIAGCYDPERAKDPKLRGKVLLKVVIGKDGTVTSSTTRSTSLRHPPTETCLNAVVAATRFPALERGETAIVTYPFVFPLP